MGEAILNVSENLEKFILMFLRTSALIISSPIFGRKNVPNLVKICFCIVLTYVAFVSYSMPYAIEYDNVIEYMLLCFKELVYGIILGYVTTLFFSLPQTAGHVTDMMMGLGMVNVFDVQSRTKVPLTGNIMYIVLIITFFTTNAHLQLIYILQATFEQVPIGQVVLDPSIAYTVVEVFVLAFVMVLNIAMPIIASGLLGEIVMGIIVRVVPQMNIFVVGLPLKVILGIFMLILILPVYVNYTDVIFTQMFDSIDTVFKGLGVAQ